MSDSLFRLRPDQLAGLLSTGASLDAACEAQEQSVGRALRAALAASLPFDGPDSAEVVSGKRGDRRLRTIGEVVLGAGADLATLRLLKNHEKHIASRNHSDVERVVATTIYYAAIAAALAFCGEKITEHRYSDLGRFLAALAAKPWLPADLRDVFTKGHQISRARAGEENAGTQA